MAVTTTTRLGLTRWSAGTDPFTRAQMDATVASIETLAAAWKEGTLAARPAAAAANDGFFYLVTSGASSGNLYVSNGSAWTQVAIGDITAYAPLAGATFTGAVAVGTNSTPQDLTHGRLDRVVGKKVSGATSGTLTLKRGQLVEQSGNATGGVTLAWDTSGNGGPISGEDCDAAVILKMGVTPQTLTVMSGVKWLGGAAPVIAASKWYYLNLLTTDGGTTTLIAIGDYS